MISVPFARSLSAPPSHSTPFVRAPHLHSFLPIPHLTTLTAVAGIHTDTALRWITGNLLRSTVHSGRHSRDSSDTWIWDWRRGE